MLGKDGMGTEQGPEETGNRFGMRIGKGWKRSREMRDGM